MTLVISSTVLISHRGNLFGSQEEYENRPDYVAEAAQRGPVEVDAWLIDGKYWLGHDGPRYQVDRYFFLDSRILTHCKNLDAIIDLARFSQAEVFFQSEERAALTSRGRMVLHSDLKPTDFSALSRRRDFIWAKPSWRPGSDDVQDGIAIITDFAGEGHVGQKQRPFDLLLLDVDGVLTDGTKAYDISGQAYSKNFCDQDFTAIKQFQAAGIPVCLVSADRNINESLARHRGIDFEYARQEDGNIDKELILDGLLQRFAAETFAYVGDDIFDLTLLNAADLSACPSNANSQVRESCDLVLGSVGGSGVVAELFAHVMRDLPRVYLRDRV